MPPLVPQRTPRITDMHSHITSLMGAMAGNTIAIPSWTAAAAIETMDEFGIELQMLSNPTGQRPLPRFAG
jgi:hypothetical protein